MGQELSCTLSYEHSHGFFRAVQLGELEIVEALLERDPSLLNYTTVYDRLSALHLAAINGQIEVISFILDKIVNPDILNRHKQTPLMLAVMHGNIACVQKLIGAGANILKFDSINGRTCLHYAAYYGHSECLKTILSAAQTSPVSDSWGFTRFVNIRDGNGATPLHLAARQRRPDCVHILLDSGALVCASTAAYGRYPGSTPLHLAARGGSLDCVRALLAWGADRLYRDESGYIPYVVALKYKHGACAALLNPTSAEPIVWPSPLKFISELNPEAKVLLERTLMEANKERENRILKGTQLSLASPSFSDGVDDSSSEGSETELCSICFDQVCTIEVQNCCHQMCAHCTLSLCCHHKPNPTSASLLTPVCPFCRSVIERLVVVKLKPDLDTEIDMDINTSKQRKLRKSKNHNEGSSSSFKSLSVVGSFGRMGARGSGRIAADSSDWTDDDDKS